MKKALMIVSVLLVAVISTACINNIAVQELNNKAAEYMQKGDYEAAMSRLQASLDLDATMYQTYYNLGVAAINAKKYDKAIEALEAGIEIKPDFADFYYSLGVAQISMADEIMEPKEESIEEDAAKTEPLKIVSDEDKTKALELKLAAVESLKTYLQRAPEAENKAQVEEMIAQSEEFLSKNTKTENVKE